MRGHIAFATGSPGPTLVLDARDLPKDGAALLGALGAARARLIAAGHERVLKFALISPSSDPMFDLDYRFVQCLPGNPDRFDLRGSCGHSILCSVMVASRRRWLAPLAPSRRVRVLVVNNGDRVVCEVDEASRNRCEFTVHFMPTSPPLMRDLLLTGEPRTLVESGGVQYWVSMASVGNPYVFVDAASVGASTQGDLFADDPDLFRRLSDLRAAAADRLGFPRDGAFPKIAAVGQFEPSRLAVRAISVPTWHPTLALTGTVCLGVTSAIAGSIPYELARRAGAEPGEMTIDTPGGSTAVNVKVTGPTLDDSLAWTSVRGKRSRLIEQVAIGGLDSRSDRPRAGAHRWPRPLARGGQGRRFRGSAPRSALA